MWNCESPARPPERGFRFDLPLVADSHTWPNPNATIAIPDRFTAGHIAARSVIYGFRFVDRCWRVVARLLRSGATHDGAYCKTAKNSGCYCATVATRLNRLRYRRQTHSGRRRANDHGPFHKCPWFLESSTHLLGTKWLKIACVEVDSLPLDFHSIRSLNVLMREDTLSGWASRRSEKRGISVGSFMSAVCKTARRE